MKKTFGLVTLALSVALAGCAIFDTPRDRAIRRTPSYRQGYEDGCASANYEASGYRYQGTVRDPLLAKSDSVYRAGWSNGFNTCRIARSPGMGTLRNPVPSVSPGYPEAPNSSQ